jgi:iron complex transport system permease protein
MTADPSPAGRSLTPARLIAWTLAGAAAVAITAALCSLAGVSEMTQQVWLNRMLRLCFGAIIGAALASGGVAMQGLLRNPLADPYILGVSSGASVGVLVGEMLAARAALPLWAGTPVLALAGALATTAVVYGIAQRRGRMNPYVLLLSGVIVNVFNGALILTLLLFQQRDAVLKYVQWGIGALPDVAGTETELLMLGVCGAAVIVGWLALLLRGSAMNALGLGDDVASSSGVRVHWLRLEVFAVVALMTSAAVALAGPIGFLGLIVPHVCRLLVGADHRLLVVVAGFGGAVFLMLADTVGRTASLWLDVGSVPVGVITALSGGPFFIALLRRRWREAT